MKLWLRLLVDVLAIGVPVALLAALVYYVAALLAPFASGGY